MSEKPCILVVEDESSIAQRLAFALETEGFAVKHVLTGEQALVEIKSCPPALAVLDIGLPDQSGFDVCKQVRKVSSLPILFLTARSEEVDRVLGLELGGDDYVCKPFSPREVVARIKAILRRQASAEGGQPGPSNPNFRIDGDSCKIYFKDVELKLARGEYRLLSVLLKRPGRVFSRDELMALAWEEPEMSLARTVDTHIKTIRAKLRAVDPKDDSIETQRGFGYSMKIGP
jgi:two-component system catabolic regulation response regulator CreB